MKADHGLRRLQLVPFAIEETDTAPHRGQDFEIQHASVPSVDRCMTTSGMTWETTPSERRFTDRGHKAIQITPIIRGAGGRGG